jgi:hypothetical protein
MGISNLPLAFKSNFCHIIWTWKSTPKASLKISPIFYRLKMILVMKKKLINQKIILECSANQYWDAWKKNQILAKTFHLFSNTWTLFFKLPQILGPIQILASSLKKHIIIIYLLKSMQKRVKNKCTQKNIIILIKSRWMHPKVDQN